MLVLRCALSLVTGFSVLPAQDVDKVVQQLTARFTPKPVRFQFALIGDQQYTPTQEKLFENTIDSMNKDKLAFVVHDGDIIGSNKPCDDATFARRLKTFGRSEHPFILTPGDNDWTDCGKATMGGYNQLERLDKVRKQFLPAPGRTLGKGPLAVLSQSQIQGFEKFVENLIWSQGQVLFATVHVVGTNNNAARPAEYEPRNAANLFWIRAAFTIAKKQRFRGVMLIMQANPHFDEKRRKPGDGFAATVAALERETLQFSGQVVLVHGDSHYFRIDKPLVRAQNNPEGARVENFTRVETFGPPDVHWIRATADPQDPMVFQFEQRIVEANIRPK
ncbi:MAG: hypothetical protein HYX27_11090 [Acidobacteria bacterium]|nr:hypothetical protein [Acidobacteriota bacterium]